MSRPVRVFIGSLAEGERRLEPAAARYLTVVHRLRSGDRFVAFDPEAGLQADARLTEVGARHATAELEIPERAPSGALPIVLFQALGKGNKVDHVIREATALGTERIVVVQTERSIPRGGSEKGRARRWRTIAVEAARQSGRGDLPSIDGPLELCDALASAPMGVRLCLDPSADVPLDAALSRAQAVPASAVSILIGPEGGLSRDELTLAEQAGFLRVQFGRLVLRTETAAVAVLGAIVARLSAPT